MTRGVSSWSIRAMVTGFSFCPSLVVDMVAFCAPHVQSNHDTPRTSYEIIKFDVMVLVSQITVYPPSSAESFCIVQFGGCPSHVWNPGSARWFWKRCQAKPWKVMVQVMERADVWHIYWPFLGTHDFNVVDLLIHQLLELFFGHLQVVRRWRFIFLVTPESHKTP